MRCEVKLSNSCGAQQQKFHSILPEDKPWQLFWDLNEEPAMVVGRGGTCEQPQASGPGCGGKCTFRSKQVCLLSAPSYGIQVQAGSTTTGRRQQCRGGKEEVGGFGSRAGMNGQEMARRGAARP